MTPDQTGYIPKRHGHSNLRHLFNIMYSDRKLTNPLTIITLDAEKAFDHVEWPYLFATLEKYELGENFIKWIRIVYANPRAKILINQILSPLFLLQRGNRQGCALSPLLFALAKAQEFI